MRDDDSGDGPRRRSESAGGGREQREHALRLWREGARLASAFRYDAGLAEEYARAVAAVVAHVRTYVTMDELLARYYRHDAALDAALERAIHPPSGRVLKYNVVEDAAFWRRARYLIAAGTGGLADEQR